MLIAIVFLSQVKHDNSYKEDWSFGSKSRIILSDNAGDGKYYDSRNHREVGIKARLDTSPVKSRNTGMLQQKMITTHTTGYRIVVSNLQPNVTQEDIKV